MLFLRELTDITGGNDEELDRNNLLHGLDHFERYVQLREILEGCMTVTGVESCEISIGEGFVSKELIALDESEIHEFRSMAFSVNGYASSKLADVLRETLSGSRNVEKVQYDDEGEFVLVVLKEEPDDAEVAFELI